MNSSVDYSSTDRFIPLRRSASECFHICHLYPNPLNISCTDYSRKCRLNQSGHNYMHQLYKRNQYNNLLVNGMFSYPRKVLYFSPEQKANQNVLCDTVISEESWPVKARRKPLINSPDLILDMPDIGISDEIGTCQKVDWGTSGHIAMIHKDSIHTSNPDDNMRLIIKSDKPLGNCLKWDRDGKKVAIALQNGGLAIWDMESEKLIRNTSWDNLYGEISAIVYTSRHLVTGHSNGMILLWNNNLIILKTVNYAHSKAILTLKVSCNENYLATTSVDGFLRIWDMPNLNELFQIISYPSPIRCLDWHPWKESIVVIGKSNKDSFCTLWNVNKPNDVITEQHPNDPNVDGLTFNPLSGELVVSIWYSKPDEGQLSQHIVVQSSLTKVVDDMNFHTTRCPYLLWDKSGTRLASAGADENLAIWNFFGEKSKRAVKFSSISRKRSIFETTIR
ncbi:hypothetical protein WA026_023458 [Henosepilachna vigintioctopunctata]|uniref:Uncharacterized protein n=1 Tax=Henosepilachna vigintioctopunctata TaxID=420089 RepID=A0AAW1VIC6_9CUCU